MTRHHTECLGISLRSRAWPILAGLLYLPLGSGVAFGQGSMATIEVRIPAAAAGRVGDAPVPVELRSTTDASLSWTALIRPGEPAMFRFVPAGQYRIVSGTIERLFHALPGDELTVEVAQPGAAAAPAARDVRVVTADRAGYGTRFDCR
jgi:hypothetical protein